MPQSQTAASSRHHEEDKKDKNIHARKTNKQMYEKHKDQLPLPQARVISMLKQPEKRGPRAEDFKTLSAPWNKPQSYTELRTTPRQPP